MGGYSNRGNLLFDINKNQNNEPILTQDKNLTFSALGYGNGPGAIKEIRTINLTKIMTGYLRFRCN